MAEVETVQLAPEQQATIVATETSWWELLGSLKTSNALSTGDALLALLQQALQAVATDSQWNSSGVPELLKRATEMAQKGSFVSARHAAINVLDFHCAAQKYKEVAAKARSGGSSGEHSGNKKDSADPAATATATSASTSSDSTSTEMAGAHPEQTAANLVSAGSTSAIPPLHTLTPVPGFAVPFPLYPDPSQALPSLDFGGFLVPENPSKRRRIVPTDTSAAAAARQHEGRLIMPAPQRPAGREILSGSNQEWSGVLALAAEDGGRASDLCHATVQLPERVATSMPRALNLTHLVQRRGVMLGHYQVCRTSIKKTNMRQMSRLRSMAQHELVAVAALECAHIIIVPYLGGPQNAEVKLVSFVLSG